MLVKQRAVAALRDARGLPPALVFVVRNANIVRALNQRLGIPVDRTRILGHYAARGLRHLLVSEAWDPGSRYSADRGVLVHRGGWLAGLGAVLSAEWRYATFRVAVGVAAVALALHSAWLRVVERFTGRKPPDVEAALDEAVRRAVEAKLGYSIDASLFSA
ncbi:hypothetical protein LPJ73_004697 [Coemansia sp. RSA 2703]|nr:hypothetical protein LPJ73_004697 [Coemansia sp. RSA 2703]